MGCILDYAKNVSVKSFSTFYCMQYEAVCRNLYKFFVDGFANSFGGRMNL